MKTALIAGATGLVGGELLRLLLANDQYSKIISIGRRRVQLEHPKLTQHIVDFSKLDKMVFNANTVFCCLGTTIKKAGSKEVFRKVDFEYPKLLAQHSLNIGATSFHLISAMGADTNSRIFYNKVKGKIENEINSSSFKQTHVYRPSLLLGSRTEKRLMEGISKFVMKSLGFLFVGSLKNYKAIDATKVAQCMIQSSFSSRNGNFIHLSGEMQ